jgi:hypothetical protein
VIRLKLQPGRYLYKFVVDGNWLVNTALQVVRNPNVMGNVSFPPHRVKLRMTRDKNITK